VRRADGTTILGLFAVGRCAAGVASRSYVSGLSLADCVFSGRNAGMAVSTSVVSNPAAEGAESVP
jgi:3-oxo-5alpha-steroid 4-dehydrogenase